MIIELFCTFWAKISSLKGTINVYGLYWGIQSYYEERRREICILGSLLMSHRISYGLCKGNIKFSECNSFYCVE